MPGLRASWQSRTQPKKKKAGCPPEEGKPA